MTEPTDFEVEESQGVGDRKTVKKTKKALDLDEQQFMEDVRKVVSTPGGRAFYWRLLEQCHVFGSSFRGEQTHTAAFSEGERNIGLWAWEWLLKSEPNAYNVARNEAQAREKNKGTN